MNIFHLHKDPRICAEYHCDKHVVKMILETAQMLSTAYRKKFNDGEELYKTAYPKHPMTIWVGNSGGNFFWTIKLLDQLLYQYTLRYQIYYTKNIRGGNVGKQNLHHHHSVCQMNINIEIILQLTEIITLAKRKDLLNTH